MIKKEIKFQADEILELAKGYGVDQNLLFATTFERYQTQLQILEKLKETIESEGFFVDKTYVKFEINLYSHPAVTQYNRSTYSYYEIGKVLPDIHALIQLCKIYGIEINDLITKEGLLEARIKMDKDCS